MLTSKLNYSAAILGFLLAKSALTAPSGHPIEARGPTVEDIIPAEYIRAVRSYYGALAEAEARSEWNNAKRALHKLQKRAPVDQACDEPEHWVSRNCMSDISPQAWEDECKDPADPEEYLRDGQCPSYTICVSHEIVKVEANGQETIIDDIICQPKTPEREDVVSGDRQYGHRSVTANDENGKSVSIDVKVDNPSSSVSALFLDQNMERTVKPFYEITGYIRRGNPDGGDT